MKTEFTKEDKEKFLKKTAQEPDTQLRALVIGVVGLLQAKKIITVEEISKAKKAGEKYILNQWKKETAEKGKEIEAAMFLDSIFGNKTEEKK